MTFFSVICLSGNNRKSLFRPVAPGKKQNNKLLPNLETVEVWEKPKAFVSKDLLKFGGKHVLLLPTRKSTVCSINQQAVTQVNNLRGAKRPRLIQEDYP